MSAEITGKVSEVFRPKPIADFLDGWHCFIICFQMEQLRMHGRCWKSLGGHWEFIGGKIEPGETPEQALARECREEIALNIVNERIRTAVTHAYPDRTIHLTLIDCEPVSGAEPTALEHSELGWFTPAEMQSLDFCPADAELLPVIFPS